MLTPPNTNRARRGPSAVLGLGLGLCIAGGAVAGPPNRVVDQIAATPSPNEPGRFDIRVTWRVEAGDQPPAEPLDLSTRLKFMVNGEVVAVLAETVLLNADLNCADQGCPEAPCGWASIGAVAVPMTCHDGGQGCGCRSPELEGALPAQALGPGDVIEVVLEPAPGAAPDPFIDNKTVQIMPQGMLGWNRAVKSARLVDVDGQQALRIEVAVTAVGYDSPTTLDFGLTLGAGPGLFDVLGPFELQVLPFDGCFLDCEPDGCPEPMHDPGDPGHWEVFCESWAWSWHTHCTCQSIYIVDAFPADFGLESWDILAQPFYPPVVSVVPTLAAPGELYTGDDAATIDNGVLTPICPEDLNDDGQIGSADLNAVLSKFGADCGEAP